MALNPGPIPSFADFSKSVKRMWEWLRLLKDYVDYVYTLAISGGGGGGNSVTATVNFGASFTDKAQTVVAAPWAIAGTEIVAHVMTPAGVDPDEMYLLDFKPVISDLNPGVGFTVTLYSEPEATGSYDVMCVGV